MRTRTSSRLHLLYTWLLVCVLPLASMAYDIEGDAANGKALWNANCASCHKLDKKLVGPALGEVTERRSLEWLISWTRDNAAFRASGDKDAIAIFNEYNGMVMPAFAQLSEQDVKDIMLYTKEGNKPVAAGPTPDGGTTAVPVEPEKDKNAGFVVMVSLAVFLALLILLLVKVKNTLKVIKGEEPTSLAQDTSFWTKAIVSSRPFIIIAILFVSVFLLKETYYALMSVGVSEGYQPEQPIAFSHKIHAGDNKVDCNYCHSSARVSKHSGIPSANVCMNCHMAIDGSEIVDEKGQLKYNGEKSPEIAKIYAAVGWDSDESKYIENYEQKPIKWIRIHNLPDLAYFNHAQHVTAGQIECQTCHGPIEEMEEVYQHSPLTMGWCINCHRETEVQSETNGYYAELHDKLKEKHAGAPITVEKIGGLECGKFNY